MAIDSYSDVNTNQTNSAGRLGRNYPNNYIESEVCGATSIKFGYGAQVKSGVVSALASGDVANISARNTFGVCTFSPGANGLDSAQYEQYDQVGFLKTGIINVPVTETIAKGDLVRVYHTTSSSKIVGMFATTAEATKTALITGARWVGASQTDASGVLIAELFLPDSITLTADT
ncbi:MAG TPA: hypothetical protein PKL30_19300 [Leptospiraceae bacterium]|nr:hypothetical protein [Leptospiraceae bacterium]HNN81046.1 hypothetical protein [Leptospiraceae bacterium]